MAGDNIAWAGKGRDGSRLSSVDGDVAGGNGFVVGGLKEAEEYTGPWNGNAHRGVGITEMDSRSGGEWGS